MQKYIISNGGLKVMEITRIYEILKNKEKADVFYNERPVWIQEVEHNKANKK